MLTRHFLHRRFLSVRAVLNLPAGHSAQISWAVFLFFTYNPAPQCLYWPFAVVVVDVRCGVGLSVSNGVGFAVGVTVSGHTNVLTVAEPPYAVPGGSATDLGHPPQSKASDSIISECDKQLNTTSFREGNQANASYQIRVSCEPEANTTVASDGEYAKQRLPIKSTEAGMMIDVNALLANASLSIRVSCEPGANTTEVSDVHCSNAAFSISIREAGSVMEVNPAL